MSTTTTTTKAAKATTKATKATTKAAQGFGLVCQAGQIFTFPSFIKSASAVRHHTGLGNLITKGEGYALTAKGVAFFESRYTATVKALAALKLGDTIPGAAQFKLGTVSGIRYGIASNGLTYPIGSGEVGRALYVIALRDLTNGKGE